MLNNEWRMDGMDSQMGKSSWAEGEMKDGELGLWPLGFGFLLGDTEKCCCGLGFGDGENRKTRRKHWIGHMATVNVNVK
jgi:hypothetical protein